MSHPRATSNRTMTRVLTRPVHRGAKLDTGPSKNDTGVPTPPCDDDPRLPSVTPAKNDTDTHDWEHSSARQQDSDEDRSDTAKPKLIPEDHADSGKDVVAIDDPPSAADVPDDMQFDPGGAGTPGIMPPVPAPLPEERNTDTKAWEPQGAYNGLDYLVPFPGNPDDD